MIEECIKVSPKLNFSLKSYLQDSEKSTSPKLGSPQSSKSPLLSSKSSKEMF